MTAPTIPALPPLENPPTQKVFPLLRSEISRISHRRLLRVFVLLFLAGIIVISAISFLTHRSTSGSTIEELEANRAEQQRYWLECSAGRAPEQAERRCGQEPATMPLDQFDYDENRQYRAKEMLPVALIATVLAAAGIAFIVGASSGGAEWSSRSMTLQLLWEPRRLRLLVIKWLGLVTVMVAVALAGLVLALGLAALTATVRGTWEGRLPREFGDDSSLTEILALMGLRGLVFVAVAATVGYGIAVLVRNTGASLGVAFVYFAVAESAARWALMKYGPEPYLLSTNTLAFLIPDGLTVPGRQVEVQDESGFTYTDAVNVHLSNVRALVTMLIYTSLLAVAAAWSFTRRDVG